MRFASLGSGSRGNATLIESAGTRLLVDCGFSAIETQRRLARLGCGAEEITALLVTHEHSDHIGGVGVLARRYSIPVWMTAGTARHKGLGKLPQRHLFSCHEAFTIDGLSVAPFPVPHDATEPSQFVFSDGQHRLGMLTDVGCWTPHIEAQLSGCDALLLESNHDEQMLRDGPYPVSLKRRVAGRHGHLSNAQAAELLQRLDNGRLQHLVAAHLSEENNSPQLVRQLLANALNCEEQWVSIADQACGLGWRDIV